MVSAVEIVGAGVAGIVGGTLTVLAMQRTCWRRLLEWLNTLGPTPDARVHSNDIIKAKNRILG